MSRCRHCGASICGCCGGRARQTPRAIHNRPGLPAVRYRSGRQGHFLESLLADLARAEVPQLRRLGDAVGDPILALLDAFATMADVITFYQERLANEHYLRTAVDPRSVRALVDLIGYRPSPGVAAGGALVFTLQTGPGAPKSVPIEIRTKIQSIPGPDELPQTYETVEAIEARPEWNALRPLAEGAHGWSGATATWLVGAALPIAAGDVLLLVGSARRTGDDDGGWWIRQLSAVHPDAERGLTRVEWRHALDAEDDVPGVHAFIMRGRANLFGYNAPDPRMMPTETIERLGQAVDAAGAWVGFDVSAFDDAGDAIHLDGDLPRVSAGQWIVLRTYGQAALRMIDSASAAARSGFGISGKTTRVAVDNRPAELALRATSALTRPEAFAVAAPPDLTSLDGDQIVVLGGHALPIGRRLMVSGPRQHVRVRAEQTLTVSGQTFGSGAVLQIVRTTDTHWTVEGPGGRVHAVPANRMSLARLARITAPPEAPVHHEEVVLKALDVLDGTQTRLTLARALTGTFDRWRTRIHANVALSTHGETTTEVLGSGDPTTPWQQFELTKAPLTHVPADVPGGAASTLEVRIDDVAWTQAAQLFDESARARVYTSMTAAGGTRTVAFGDGINGARLPAGHQNVTARYRVGVGRAGEVGASTLSLLLTRPLGVRSVTNPLPTGGAEDPEGPSDTRAAAPGTVTTLGRVISLRDHADFARAFSGVAKAHAEWTWNRDRRGVILTVAGPGGAEVPEATRDLLRSAIVRAAPHHVIGDREIPITPVEVKAHAPVEFRLRARLRIDPRRSVATVFQAARATLYATFGFGERAFGQGVSAGEVLAALHGLDGVLAARLETLFGPGDAPDTLRARIDAALPAPGGDATRVEPAQLLVLADGLVADPELVEGFGFREWT